MRSGPTQVAAGSLALVLLGLVPNVAARPGQELVYDIPRLDGIAIDGKASDWGQGGFQVDLLVPPGGDLKPVMDCDARMRLGWDADGLLVLVAVALETRIR